jgi:hypothetical protein
MNFWSRRSRSGGEWRGEVGQGGLGVVGSGSARQGKARRSWTGGFGEERSGVVTRSW